MIVTLGQLLTNEVIELDDEDPGCFDSYVVKDGFSMQAELEPDTWGEVVVIQRVLDDDHPDHLILLDCHGNSTDIGSHEATIRLYQELDTDWLT